jgi:V8-like Glu-specific endopeptidase
MIANTAVEDSKTAGLKKLDTDTLANNQYMCKSERFSSTQSFYVSCSGFLIAPDLLMTAGHCAINFGEARNEANPYCTDFSWYFDFEADSAGNVKTDGVRSENIYQCEKIIHVAHTSIPLSETQIQFADDFAIIKLNRPVTGRKPFNLTAERPKPQESITMTGHPLGGPKMSVKGVVLSNEAAFDRAAVSGFDGNSGSPVFNSRGEVFGILVRGYPPSLIDSGNGSCNIVNRCTADAKNCTQADPYGQPAGDHIMPIGLIPELKTMGLVK